MKKILSFVMCTTIMLSLVLDTHAVSVNESINTLSTTENVTDELISYKGTIEQLPDYIQESYNENEKAEALDIYDEDPYSVTTNNTDGSKTVEIFQTPIKYIEDNEIKFIDTKLEELSSLDKALSTHFYKCTKAPVKSFFPNHIKDGVTIANDEYEIKCYPNIQNKPFKFKDIFSKPTLNEKNILKYEDVFDDNDNITYTPISNGVKEEIIIEEYNGNNIYEFTIELKNLEPLYLSGDSIPLIDKATGEEAASISQIDMRDSSQDQAFNTSLFNKIELSKIDGDIYNLKIILDHTFLTAETTVYPVIVDPTITFNADPIYDAPVFSGYPSTNFNSNTYNVVGYHGSTYGEGIAFIKINNIQNYVYINPNNITSAYLKLYEGSGKTSSATVGVYNTKATWSNTSVTYNNMPKLNASPYSSKTISSSGWYNFNIKGFIKNWLNYALKDGGKSQNYGLALKMTSTGVPSRHFCSANNSTYPPSIIINYKEDSSFDENVYYIFSENSDMYLTAKDSNIIQKSYNQQPEQHWSVINMDNGYYYLKSSSSNFKKFLTSASTSVSDGTNIGISTATNSRRLFRIIKNADGTYRILSKCGSYIYSLYVENSSTANNANIQLCKYTGETAQRWRFYAVNKQQQTNINLLQSFATNYDENNSNILVFQYIRSNKYASSLWAEVAGEINTGFATYIKSNFSHLETMKTKDQYCYSGTSQCIDLTHLCATANAILYDSTSTRALLAGEKTVDDLAGWAGDFQSLVAQTIDSTGNSDDYDTFYNEFKSKLGSSKSKFPYSDIYADLDAIYFCDHYAESGALGTKIYNYYADGTYKNRYIYFIDGRDYNEFYDDVYKYAKNKLLGVKHWPIYEDAGCSVTTTQAKASAKAFTDFIFEKI